MTPRRRFTDFVARVLDLRRKHPVFSRRRFLKEGEVVWLTPDAREMTQADWDKGYARCMGIYLRGTTIERVDVAGGRCKDDDFVVLFNAHHEPIPFLLPKRASSLNWTLLLDTSREPIRSQRGSTSHRPSIHSRLARSSS